MGVGARRWYWPAVVAVVLAAAATVVYRVVTPTEVLTPVRASYPADAVPVEPGVIGTLIPAPLIVEGRLRIYASTRQVRADASIGARTSRTPYWSYRRWPAQLTGVLAIGDSVVSRWSDGELVALNARTGTIAWRTPGPEPDRGYQGRRTGAATVYIPSGLHRGTVGDGRTVLVVAAAGELRGFDPTTGRQLWQAVDDDSCRSDGFTTTSGHFVTIDGCGSPMVKFRDLTNGAVVRRWHPGPVGGTALKLVPLGCEIDRSACPAMRTTSAGTSRGWLLDGALPVAAPVLDHSGGWLVGEVVVGVKPRDGTDSADSDRPSVGTVVGRSVRTGVQLWRRAVPDDAQVIAAQPARVHLLTADRQLLTLDPASGDELSRFPLVHGRQSTDWSPGHVYASDGFVAVERLAPGARPGDSDTRYYAAIEPVIFART